ncbi:alpha/beta hydrolase [Desulfatitalea alkaliphila]|uniref:Alpha/beta hydrolase n=1 Tax=Desulfatitalea alkaliphila TaxID=2929485 RepID=A0AA41R7M1_9BACT|nr:alpha/beta hydrolase [Desulfatitalea alkaliphila]MCJ8503043.1 alpha/beta hydrolase [Desulfatitalea alkaliphila]
MTTRPTNPTTPINPPNSINSTNPPNSHTIHFKSDGHRLTGTLHLPDVDRPPVVIGCHGLLADRRSPKQIALANALGRLGIAYLRFDHRGCGDSQGHLAAEHLLDDRCRDLYHAMQTLQTLAIPSAHETDNPTSDQGAATGQHPPADRHTTTLDTPPAPTTLGPLIALFGSSFGGTVIMATAAVHPVPCLITYAAPIQSRAIEAAAAEQLKSHAPQNLQQVARLSFDITPLLPALHHILVIHGDQDEIVPPSHARRIHQLAQPPKQLILQPGGDHRMTDAHHQARFLESCTAWIQTCLQPDQLP